MKNALIALAIVLMMVSTVGAATFTLDGEAVVSADDNAVVQVSGTGAGQFGTLTQYCQWEFRGDCANNVAISNSGAGYQLNRDGLANHQNSFNFHKKGGGEWLLIPNKAVKAGKNIQIVTKDQNGNVIPEGARFQYVGPIPGK
jgi:hypothetical protein